MVFIQGCKLLMRQFTSLNEHNLREFVKSLEILVNRLGLCVKLLAGKTCFTLTAVDSFFFCY